MFNKDKKMVDLINQHYSLEQFASNVYNYFSSIANKNGYTNIAKFMHTLANDKVKAHMPRVYKYILDLNEELKITQNIDFPSISSTNDIGELLRKMSLLEFEIRKNVQAIVEYALSVKDYETFDFIQWFINDCIKDINDLNRFVDLFDDPIKSRMLIESAAREILEDLEEAEEKDDDDDEE